MISVLFDNNQSKKTNCKLAGRFYLLQKDTEDLFVNNPDYAFLSCQGNSVAVCMSKESSRRTGIHHLHGRRRRRTTSHNFFCDLDICSSTHACWEHAPCK